MSADTLAVPEICTDWSDFLARHDLMWDRLPTEYANAPFLGNGLLGSIMYYDRDTGAIKVEVFRSDVHDHRDQSDGWTACSRSRFVIGHFLLHTKGNMRGGTMRLDLWNAELSSMVSTTEGNVSFSHYIHAIDELMLFNLHAEGNETIDSAYVHSEAGEPCRIIVDIEDPVCSIDGRKAVPPMGARGAFEPTLQTGEGFLIRRGDATDSICIEPLKAQIEECNRFGLRNNG